MRQLSLPNMPDKDKIVNISSVPHRSPFRYPGGKTWLIPTIRYWLALLSYQPRHFIEPFAGGGITGLTVAFENMADHVTLVEIDSQVAAVWQTIIEDGQGKWLGQKITEFELTLDRVHELLSKSNLSTRRRALQTIIKNRVNRGGILANGAGMLKAGENGRGIQSRWYPETLQRRINHITHQTDKLSFIFGDGLEVIQNNLDSRDTCYFIDPPYTAAGKRPGSRLYNHSEIDHESLFALASSIEGDFLMTYNNHEEIIRLANRHGFDTEPIAMRNTHHAKKTELLISHDLSWIRQSNSD